MSGSNQAAPIGPTIAILPPLPQSDIIDANDGKIISNSSSAASMQQQQTPTSQQQSMMQQSPQPSMQKQQQQSPNPGGMPNPDTSSARLSSQWSPDSQSHYCSACQAPFDAFFNRRHHCRLCGLLFCHNCSNTRSLIPPSALVLKASGGRNAGSMSGPWLDPRTGQRVMLPAPSSNVEGDSSITYVNSNATTSNLTTNDDTLLYGKGLEQRILLARHPQRVCHSCSTQLAPIQNELCLRNSNAMRYNYIDEGDALRRLCNSPLAFTLGHEVRKAAYTLGNLLPGKKVGRSGAFAPTSSSTNNAYTSYPPPEADPCHIPNGGGCKIDPTLRNIDKLHIPAKLLQQAKGVAIITSCKGGLGFAGFEFGTGLVVARRNDGSSLDDWTAPCAIGAYSIAWGALVGAQLSDHVFLLMTDDAVRLFSSEKGKSIQLGVDVGVALGPLGRSAEADIGATPGMSRSLDGSYSRNSNGIAMAPIYTSPQPQTTTTTTTSSTSSTSTTRPANPDWLSELTSTSNPSTSPSVSPTQKSTTTAPSSSPSSTATTTPPSTSTLTPLPTINDACISKCDQDADDKFKKDLDKVVDKCMEKANCINDDEVRRTRRYKILMRRYVLEKQAMLKMGKKVSLKDLNDEYYNDNNDAH